MPKDKYIDKSRDKDYFSMIPHYVTNHSTAYEQSLYLQMKRIAGENRTCWASPTLIGKRMKASANTVRKYRKKLLERGWIRKVGEKRVGKTKQVIGEYEVVDLWKLNMDYYNKLKTARDEPFNQSPQQVSRKTSPAELKTSAGGNKEEQDKNNYIKKSKQATQSVALNPLIEKFEKVNPSYERLFANKTERASLERLVKKFGLEKMSDLLDALPSVVSKKFAPRITTPYQLEKKMGELLIFIRQEKSKKGRKLNFIL